MSERGETLSEVQLAQGRPVRGEGGRSRRAYCPFHGGDQQRSLRVEEETGRFQCFACGVWGYMDWARERFAEGKKAQGAAGRSLRASLPRKKAPEAQKTGDWAPWLAEYQAALAGSPGGDYLEERKIPLKLAVELGLGYAAAGRWAHRGETGAPLRDWKWGRLVFPHTSPAGLVNLYGRALGTSAPKTLRHDHLPGPKGYFHFPALSLAAQNSAGRVYVCEGPFDALSLMAATGGRNAVAIFGVNGWRPEWAVGVREVVFAMDADAAGEKGWRQIARGLAMTGRRVRYLEPEVYGGAKDLNEAWVEGLLDLEKLQKTL